MITSLVFSMLAFFIVATTTIVVIKNKSKVNSLSKNVSLAKVQINNDKHDNHSRLNNLVNEINHNNSKLEHEQKMIRNEVDHTKKKQNAKIENLDKRFNSYKNITTANFMGMNNRMAEEDQRLQENIDLNYKRIKENRRFTESNVDAINVSMRKQQAQFDNFYKNDYTEKINVINSELNTNANNLTNFRNSLENAIIDHSNLNLSARQALRETVIDKYNDVNDSLTNFFNLDDHFIDTHYSKTSNNTLFRNWFDTYYNIGNRTNFQTMDDMIVLADSNVTRLDTHSNQLNTMNIIISDNTNKLQSTCNLYKEDLNPYMKTNYNFDLNNLSTIASNAEKINILNDNIASLSNSLQQIGIFDVQTEGSITLEQLYQGIQSNQNSISENSNMMTNMFENRFGEYLGTNLSAYYETISQNILPQDIVNKLSDKHITACNVSVTNSLDVTGDVIFGNDLDVGGDIQVKGRSLKTDINNNKNYIDTLHKVFNLNDVDNKTIENIDTVEKDLLVKLNTNDKTDQEIGGGTGYQGESVELKAGADLVLSSRQFNNGRITETVGGKIFVDSFDDIGIIQRDGTGYYEIDEFKRYQTSDTLGQKFESLSNYILSVNQRVDGINSTVQNNGVTKSSLYNVIHNPTEGYRMDPNASYDDVINGSGVYKDTKPNSFRIMNLYTGEPSGVCLGNNTDKVCKTVEDRLNALEIETGDTKSLLESSASDSKLIEDTLASQYGITKDTDNVNIDKNLIVNRTTTLKDVNVQGNLDIGTNTNSKLRLKNTNDLQVYNVNSGGYVDYATNFVTKDQANAFITDITKKADDTGFTYRKGDDDPVTISFPASPANTVSSGDTKTFGKNQERINIDNSRLGLDLYTAKSYGGVDEDVYIPKEFVQKIEVNSEGNYDITKVKELSAGNYNTVTTSINPGVNTKSEILSVLSPGSLETDPVPTFGSGIKLGGHCLKINDKTLKICESDCTGCIDVWDTNSAPRPVTSGSPINST